MNLPQSLLFIGFLLEVLLDRLTDRVVEQKPGWSRFRGLGMHWLLIPHSQMPLIALRITTQRGSGYVSSSRVEFPIHALLLLRRAQLHS